MIIYQVTMNDDKAIGTCVLAVVVAHENESHAVQQIKLKYETQDCVIVSIKPLGRAFTDDQTMREICCDAQYR